MKMWLTNTGTCCRCDRRVTCDGTYWGREWEKRWVIEILLHLKHYLERLVVLLLVEHGRSIAANIRAQAVECSKHIQGARSALPFSIKCKSRSNLCRHFISINIFINVKLLLLLLNKRLISVYCLYAWLFTFAKKYFHRLKKLLYH